MRQRYPNVSLAIKEGLRRKSVLLANAITIFKSYNCHTEAKGWMGSQVVFPRGKQLHVMPKTHVLGEAAPCNAKTILSLP